VVRLELDRLTLLAIVGTSRALRLDLVPAAIAVA